ncbi:MAG: ComEC/Rec2 family competence protein [Patescibacteria group bacterium]
MFGKNFRRTTIIATGCFSFLTGLAVAGQGVVWHHSYIALALIIFMISVTRLKTLSLVSVIILCSAIGITRGHNFSKRLNPIKSNYDKKVVMQVRAASDGVYTNKAQISFDGDNLQFIEPIQTANIPGRLLIEGYGTKGVLRGDLVMVEGKLRQIRGSRQGVVGFADLRVIGRDNSKVEVTRRGFVAGLSSALPEPQASFAAGLLIGQRTTIPDTLKKELSATGLTHIIAVSGYNLTIIVRGVMRLMRGRSKFQIVVTTSVIVCLFLLITGFSASIVRAALVCGLSLFAWYFGRQFKPWLLIGIVAAVTAGVYPIYIWSDIGWYLSFLAFGGILVLAPLLHDRIFKKRKAKLIELVLLETFCAQIMTLPLILYIFQEVSIISLLANLLIVPLVPLAMLFSALAGIAGMSLQALSGWLAWPARGLLTYMLDLTSLLSRPRGILIERVLSVSGLIFLYACLTLIIIILSVRKRGLPRATITEYERTF